MSYALQLKNLTKKFEETTAVNDVSFDVSYGEIIALLGPNGAGKSTLMNMISGFLAPSDGKILVDGLDISDTPIVSKEKIGFLPEGSPLYPDMSVKMFLEYMAALRGASSQEIKTAINLAKIQDVLHQKIETLSKGYLRRVGFAQSILNNPKILLLDEPTDGLDPNQKDHMRKLISELGKDKAILISTHLLEEAETVCNRIILINHGRILADGCCQDILKKTKAQSLEDAFRKLTTTKGE